MHSKFTLAWLVECSDCCAYFPFFYDLLCFVVYVLPLMISSFGQVIPSMKQLWRNFPQGFLSMVIYFGLTMKDFVVSTVRSITCFIASELVNVDVATLSKFNFPYLLIVFLFTYILIDYGVIALSIVENLIKTECSFFFFSFLWVLVFV